MKTLADVRALGPHPAWQVALSPNHDLVEDPVSFDEAGAVPPLTFHGGETIAEPRVVSLISGPFWSDTGRLATFVRDITENGYLSLGGSQGFGSGRYLGQFAIPAPQGTSLTDTQCQAMIAAALATDPTIPRPDGATIYQLFLPDGVKVAFTAGGETSCTTFCAYHSSTPSFLYTVQPATTCGPCNQGDPWVALCMVTAHELAEACANPRGTGWYNDETGQENADEVAWIPRTFGPWTVQGYAARVAGQWINAVGPYVPPDALSPLYDWLRDVGAYEATAHDQAELAVIVREILTFDPDAGKAAA